MGKWWAKSSYLSESYAGTSNAYVYSYCFSADPALAFETGSHYSVRKFVGAEQLILQFNGSLASNVQIDVYAYLEAAIEQGPTTIKKLAIQS